MPDPADAFETWLLHRIADAVEGNEVSAAFLTDLHAAMAEARARPPEARDALGLLELAERVHLSVDRLPGMGAWLEYISERYPGVRTDTAAAISSGQRGR